MEFTVTVAKYIVHQLTRWGVRNIYGVSGDAIFPLLDALGRQEEINFYAVAHEGTAAFMAAAEGRLTGRPGVCVATGGPGAVNLLNGLADAYFDRVPVLAITGQVAGSQIGTRIKQYLDQQILFNQVSDHSALLVNPQAIINVLYSSMRQAIAQRTVSHIAIPKDIFQTTLTLETYPLPDYGARLPGEIIGDLQQATDLMKKAIKPLILVGRGTWEMGKPMAALAQKWGAGIITALSSRTLMAHSFPLLIGGLGEAYLPPVLYEADLLLQIGEAPYEEKYLPAQLPTIRVEIAPGGPAKPRPGNQALLTGEPGLILGALITGLNGHQPDRQWLARIEQIRQDKTAEINEYTRDNTRPVMPQRVIAALNQTLPQDALLVFDTGEFMHWFNWGFQASGHQQMILSDYWRCMGAGLPQALGAQVTFPQRKVVVLAGDGGFHLALAEVATAVKYHLPVKVVVFNNGIFALEKHKMAKGGLKPFAYEVPAMDFSLLAQAYGAEGYRVEDPAILHPVLAQAFNSPNPAIVDIITASPLPDTMLP
ncbi:MAG: thiamine pyrophosphate-binding protein [Clostridia bacterium]|nr:thiamine pyrophosphate-binding protein [Clostridia bacterium]